MCQIWIFVQIFKKLSVIHLHTVSFAIQLGGETHRQRDSFSFNFDLEDVKTVFRSTALTFHVPQLVSEKTEMSHQGWIFSV